MITYWSNAYLLIKWLPTDQMITYWSNDYLLIKWLPTDQMLTYWSNAYLLIKFLPTDQMITYWSNTDYSEWLFTVSGVSFQFYHGKIKFYSIRW
jgi:hypothetical protein